MKSQGVRFRRSPFIVCCWSGGQLVFENYAARVRVAADAVTCEILDLFDRWQPIGFLFRRMSQFSRSSLHHAVAELTRHSLLQRSDRRERHSERAMNLWKSWSPAADFFHFSTKDVQYTSDPMAEALFLRKQLKTSPIPESVKCYPQARKFRLPAPAQKGDFPQVLLTRRTWRQFSEKPVELSALSTLLKLTWGIQRWIDVRGYGRLPLKTSPSGGARHPVEAYLLALRVTGLPRGLYHYAADVHCLELLKRGASSQQIISFLPAQWFYSSAAALIFMTAIFPRVQWKYKSPRAYRAVLLEAGHLCQTFCLAATWLGLAPFCTLALADSRVETFLGVDGVTESIVYAAGVGTRPKRWTIMPKPVPR